MSSRVSRPWLAQPPQLYSAVRRAKLIKDATRLYHHFAEKYIDGHVASKHISSTLRKMEAIRLSQFVYEWVLADGKFSLERLHLYLHEHSDDFCGRNLAWRSSRSRLPVPDPLIYYRGQSSRCNACARKEAAALGCWLKELAKWSLPMAGKSEG